MLGTRLPAIRQLADQYGVAVGTVQAAVRDLVRAGVLISRRRVGTTLAPSCNPDRIRALIAEDEFAQPDKREHPSVAGKRVQIVHIDCGERLVMDMVERVALTLSKHLCCVERVPVSKSLPVRLHRPDTDAIVVIQPPHQLEPRLDPHQVLLVISTERVEINAIGRYDLLTVDDEHGSFLAGRRIKTAGCRSACFIGARQGKGSTLIHATSVRRLRGFERGWGQAVPTQHVLVAQSYNIGPGEAMAPALLALSPRPDAVFAATDELAVGLIRGLREHGLTPGRDLHVVGFDKQEIALTVPSGPLTTIEIPRIQMAVRGAQALVERLSDPDQPIRRLYLGCSLFEGTTCRPRVNG